ncbi:amino acid adenylation domain-containing protein [Priestia filamentosa]|uniref:amino acid adenylation domain-containing protein n=1 Tax=Priestia filamentosa TaxID=1402861 RepID=UPI003981D849
MDVKQYEKEHQVDKDNSLNIKMHTNFNNSKYNYNFTGNFVEYFESAVEKNPNGVAVTYRNNQITYSELNGKANSVARILKGSGVKNNDVIGIMMNRSIETIISILGVLKSGGAYLPLDPNQPYERLLYMVEDSNLKTLLVDSNFQPSKDKNIFESIKYVEVDSALLKLTSNLNENLEVSDLCYVIYTSGTTGNPKGVMVEHKNVVNLVNWMIDVGNMGHTTKMLQSSSFIFDASVIEIFPCLAAGGEICILDNQQKINPEDILDHLVGAQAFMIPSLFKAVVDYAETFNKTDKLSGFEKVYLGAEPLPSDLITKFSRLCPHKVTDIANLYGPTEGTVVASAYFYHNSSSLNDVTIGSPIKNGEIYIVKDNKLCGIEDEGELYVGGAGVARGYLNKPELTNEKYVTLPHISDKRLYKTGDVGYWKEDGTIKLLGRADEQVKINGYRIELTEIETKIRELEGINDALVIYDQSQKPPLFIAFYQGNRVELSSEMKELLQKNLPCYMIPNEIVKVEEFPLTAGGKLDKRKLIEDYISNYVDATKPEEVNEILLTFSEVLGKTSVSMNDNFFELGGDSIKAIQIISKLRQRKYDLSVKEILENKVIEKIYSKVKPIDNLEVNQEEVTGLAELSPIQETFFKKMRINEPNYFNQSYILETSINPDIKIIKNVLNAIVKHHDLLRAIYTNKSQNILPYEEDKYFELSVTDFTYIQDEKEFTKSFISETSQIQRSINIENGPLFKVGLFKCINKSYLFFCIHHLSIDGISWRILINDFIDGYEMQMAGKEIKLPLKTISFKEWSQALREYGKSNKLAKEIPYWKEVNSKVPQGKFRKTPHFADFKLNTMNIELDERYTNEMLYDAGKAYNTEINDILITGLTRAIQIQTGNSVVAINMEGHGREAIHKDVKNDRTIGWFTSEYPIVLENLGTSIAKDIINVKETVRKIPNRGMGNLILQCVSPEIFNDIEPDITFNYLGEFGQDYQGRTFSTSHIEKAKDKSMQNAFRTPITINGSIINKVLRMEITYDEKVFTTDFVSELMNQFINQLEDVITFCKKKESNYYTASDLGEYEWSNEEFEQVRAKYDERGYEIEKIHPLTSMQEAMLYRKISSPNSSEYVVQMTNDVKRNIDVSLMSKSLEIMANKYSVLRTAIESYLVAIPRQIILKDRKLEFSFVDLTSQSNKVKRFKEIQKADIRRGFNFEEDSLLRLTVIKLDDKNYKLLITFHHIILDGWCSSILRNELFEVYERLETGTPYENLLSNEGEGNTTFSDYVHLAENRNNEDAHTYWKELIEDFEDQIIIKPEGNPDGGDIDDVGKVEHRLPKELYNKLEKFCVDQGYTINTVIETLWTLTLAAYTNKNDIVFGKVVSGRNIDIPGIETMMGMCINTVPVRVSLKGDDTLSTLLDKVQEQSINTAQYEHYPLAEIQKLSQLGDELFKNAFSFENYEQFDSKDMPNNSFKLEDIRELTNFNLSLGAVRRTDFYLSIMYDLNLYGESEVSRILTRMVSLLEQTIDNPQSLISEVNYFDAGEEEKVLIEYNKTEDPLPANATLVSLFEKQVSIYPDNIAAEFDGQSLSYKELNSKANSVAATLLQKGTSVGDIIPVITKPSLELVIGVLGVLKAGAAYLPIDPEQPMKRIHYMLNEVKAKVILHGTESPILDDISLDILQLEMSSMPDLNQEKNSVPIKPNSLAYIIFTSGTTGNPKGVMVSHLNSLNHTLWQIKNGSFNSQSTMVQTIAFTFDGHTAELFPSLLSGGKLLIVNEVQRKKSDALLELIPGNKITFIPSLLREVVVYAKETGRTELLSQFDTLFVAAEPITWEEINEIVGDNKHKLNDVYHFYGPTEATVTIASHQISDSKTDEIIPIGRPISNTKLYVINDFGNICGTGMVGELCVTGLSVSSGYLNQPALTDEKFVPNSFEDGGKMYKTGDLVRWSSQGKIEFLGRVDDQIKIRGFRVEIQEINVALRMNETIQDAVVTVKELNGEKHLCAYVVSNERVNVKLLQEAVSRKLPDYMVPSYVVQLAKIPTTRNGKVNKAELPNPVLDSTVEYMEPKTETQKILIQLFKKVLGVEKIGIKDSFFDLGGHSLRVIRLLNYIERELQVKITVRDVNEEKTVERISSIIDTKESDAHYEDILVAAEVD